MGVSAKSSLRPSAAPRLPSRYRVRRHVASGGMASVWCAEDRLLDRSVAVKVLAERFAHDEFAVRRFKREARTAARVSGHPHVVTIFDVGEIEPSEEERGDADGPPRRAFMVMEYLSGGTVADALRVGAVQRHEAIRWMEHAASALDHAHKRGIVHRDMKPANFLLDNDRVLHVADFGIARLQSEDTITSSGELFGTAAYLSPEQALGGEATGASDRYSLAVAAFELLAGRRPFSATHFAAQARQHVDEEVPRASEIESSLPPAVDEVLMKGMAKQPHERYESAGSFVAALERALEEPVTARTVPLPSSEPATRPLPARERTPREAAPSRTAREGAPRKRMAAAGLAAAAAAPVLAPDEADAAAAPSATAKPSPGPDDGSPRPPYSLIESDSRPPRRRGRMAALAALAVVILGVAALALGHGSSKPSARISAQTSPSHKSTKAAKAAKSTKSHHRAAATSASSSSTTTDAAAPASTSTSESSSAATGSAASLQLQGHQELAAGSYPQAISTLHRALSAADPSSLTYAYALYDLGRALTLDGNPQAAIPVLEQRLKIPDQTATVQQALDQARAAAGQSSPGSSAPAASSSAPAASSSGAGTDGAAAPPGKAKAKAKPKAGAGPGDKGTGSGGAGLPPGQAKHGN